MFWSLALYSGTYFQISVAINLLFQASLRKLAEFVLVPQLRLLSWKTSQKKLHIEQYVLLLSNRIGKAAEFWWFWWWGHFVCLCWVSYFLLFFRQLESNSICKGSKILYMSLDNVPELLDFCSSLSIKFIERAKDWARWGIGCDTSFQCQNKVTVSCSSPSWFDRC